MKKADKYQNPAFWVVFLLLLTEAGWIDKLYVNRRGASAPELSWSENMNTREISRRLLRIILTVLVLLLCLTACAGGGKGSAGSAGAEAEAAAETGHGK